MLFGTHGADPSTYVKDFNFLKVTNSVHLIPGENPGHGFLCGTNVYVIG